MWQWLLFAQGLYRGGGSCSTIVVRQDEVRLSLSEIHGDRRKRYQRR